MFSSMNAPTAVPACLRIPGQGISSFCLSRMAPKARKAPHFHSLPFPAACLWSETEHPTHSSFEREPGGIPSPVPRAWFPRVLCVLVSVTCKPCMLANLSLLSFMGIRSSPNTHFALNTRSHCSGWPKRLCHQCTKHQGRPHLPPSLSPSPRPPSPQF